MCRADAYLLRTQGEPLENAWAAVACYWAALPIYLDDLWRWAMFAHNGDADDSLDGCA